MACQFPYSLGQQSTLGLLYLAHAEGRRELVGLVKDDEIPISGSELELDLFVASQLVEACDQ